VKTHGSPPCEPGQRLTIGRHGPIEGTLGCSEFDSAAVADAPAIATDGQPETRTYEHELGSIEVFFEPVVAPAVLVVCGATPVARQLLRFAAALGFDTVLFEPRRDRVTERDSSAANRVVSLLDEVDIGHSYFVHTDHDAPDVVDSLAAALQASAPYVGMMGSRRHIGPHLEQLRERGLTGDDLARLQSPAGLDLGGRTPAEIALSIAAGLVARRHGRAGGWLSH
jgi:xanthine/CO dehydrogenase XdhC/CoxF family maturation factor